jgi:hypothetical protein
MYLINMVNSMDIENLTYITTTTHSIWYGRNKLVFGNKDIPKE